MIGGGGKIGGPGGVPRPLDAEAKKADANKEPATSDKRAVVGDKFEKGAAQQREAQKLTQKPQAFAKGESSGTADMLRLARQNPAQARKLVATMGQQAAKVAGQIQEQMAAAKGALEQLAAQKFSKKKLKEKRRELRKLRDKISALKRRLSMSTRKMSLLQQLAGKLGDPRLEEELDRLLNDHDRLNTDWGRQHHLLGMGEVLYSDDPETPDHLREVVRAEIRAGSATEELGDDLQEVSPRRIIAELIARSIDGSVRDETPDTKVDTGAGRTMQSYDAIKDVFNSALLRDALAKKADD